MFFAVLLLASVPLFTAVLGAIPSPGGPYFIQNVATGLVFDVFQENPAPGNAINGFTVNPGHFNAQQWFITLVSFDGNSSAIYTFFCPGVGTQGIYIREDDVLGSGLTAQNAPTPLRVTDLTGNGVYRIAYPFGTLAVTTDSIPMKQLTMRQFNVTNGQQQWMFVPQPGFEINGMHPLQKVPIPADAASTSGAE